MPITPDTKDWTWVLERVCPECGFDVRSFPREEMGDRLRDSAKPWPQLLLDPRSPIRPRDDVWSALEYGCHVRDVFGLYDRRLRMMLEQDDPLYPNWDQDETAVEQRYSEQDPTQVASELGLAAAALAERFDSVEGDDWERTGTRSDGARFTIETFGRYLLHDPVHHLHDVERGYEQIVPRG